MTADFRITVFIVDLRRPRQYEDRPDRATSMEELHRTKTSAGNYNCLNNDVCSRNEIGGRATGS